MITFRDTNATKTPSSKASTLSAITSETTSPDEEDDLRVPSDDQQEDDVHHHQRDNNDDDDDDDGDGDEQDSSTAPICECGRELDSGWKCSHCRRQCPICNRSLSLDVEDIAFGSIECQQCKNN
ncbi:hypothetical protein PS6_000506 [Mucor atramentarius]